MDDEDDDYPTLVSQPPPYTYPVARSAAAPRGRGRGGVPGVRVKAAAPARSTAHPARNPYQFGAPAAAPAPAPAAAEKPPQAGPPSRAASPDLLGNPPPPGTHPRQAPADLAPPPVPTQPVNHPCPSASAPAAAPRPPGGHPPAAAGVYVPYPYPVAAGYYPYSYAPYYQPALPATQYQPGLPASQYYTRYQPYVVPAGHPAYTAGMQPAAQPQEAGQTRGQLEAQGAEGVYQHQQQHQEQLRQHQQQQQQRLQQQQQQQQLLLRQQQQLQLQHLRQQHQQQQPPPPEEPSTPAPPSERVPGSAVPPPPPRGAARGPVPGAGGGGGAAGPLPTWPEPGTAPATPTSPSLSPTLDVPGTPPLPRMGTPPLPRMGPPPVPAFDDMFDELSDELFGDPFGDRPPDAAGARGSPDPAVVGAGGENQREEVDEPGFAQRGGSRNEEGDRMATHRETVDQPGSAGQGGPQNIGYVRMASDRNRVVEPGSEAEQGNIRYDREKLDGPGSGQGRLQHFGCDRMATDRERVDEPGCAGQGGPQNIGYVRMASDRNRVVEPGSEVEEGNIRYDRMMANDREKLDGPGSAGQGESRNIEYDRMTTGRERVDEPGSAGQGGPRNGGGGGMATDRSPRGFSASEDDSSRSGSYSSKSSSTESSVSPSAQHTPPLAPHTPPPAPNTPPPPVDTPRSVVTPPDAGHLSTGCRTYRDIPKPIVLHHQVIEAADHLTPSAESVRRVHGVVSRDACLLLQDFFFYALLNGGDETAFEPRWLQGDRDLVEVRIGVNETLPLCGEPYIALAEDPRRPGRPVVRRVQPGGFWEKAGVCVGMELASVNGSVTDRLAKFGEAGGRLAKSARRADFLFAFEGLRYAGSAAGSWFTGAATTTSAVDFCVTVTPELYDLLSAYLLDAHTSPAFVPPSSGLHPLSVLYAAHKANLPSNTFTQSHLTLQLSPAFYLRHASGFLCKFTLSARHQGLISRAPVVPPFGLRVLRLLKHLSILWNPAGSTPLVPGYVLVLLVSSFVRELHRVRLGWMNDASRTAGGLLLGFMYWYTTVFDWNTTAVHFRGADDPRPCFLPRQSPEPDLFQLIDGTGANVLDKPSMPAFELFLQRTARACAILSNPGNHLDHVLPLCKVVRPPAKSAGG
ncbi:hypothetical protein DIPPA_07644 [Diplonema papillatum]|nr:hypothetical protein DIPPA_07644 [Diplonema papillatum]KAJ9460267.1 hypothetical protein DIPPA_07644 [Diplonema papillatum]